LAGPDSESGTLLNPPATFAGAGTDLTEVNDTQGITVATAESLGCLIQSGPNTRKMEACGE
jgi:hypothetical protein